MKAGRLRPNGLLGTRTEFTMKSENNWYIMQRKTARSTILLGYSMFLWVPVFCINHSALKSFFLLLVLVTQIVFIVLFWIDYFKGTKQVQSTEKTDSDILK
ncbi:SdpI family protein [Mobiluncus mulieris]